MNIYFIKTLKAAAAGSIRVACILQVSCHFHHRRTQILVIALMSPQNHPARSRRGHLWNYTPTLTTSERLKPDDRLHVWMWRRLVLSVLGIYDSVAFSHYCRTLMGFHSLKEIASKLSYCSFNRFLKQKNKRPLLDLRIWIFGYFKFILCYILEVKLHFYFSTFIKSLCRICAASK